MMNSVGLKFGPRPGVAGSAHGRNWPAARDHHGHDGRGDAADSGPSAIKEGGGGATARRAPTRWNPSIGQGFRNGDSPMRLVNGEGGRGVLTPTSSGGG
jgi:hypothetical protein